MLADWGDDEQRQMFTAGLAMWTSAAAQHWEGILSRARASSKRIVEDLDYELARLRDTKSDTSKNFFQAMSGLDVDRLLHL